MTQVSNFILLANFNKLANEKIITACNKLTEIEYKKDRGAFFSLFMAHLIICW